jgi:hypothetical protein
MMEKNNKKILYRSKDKDYLMEMPSGVYDLILSIHDQFKRIGTSMSIVHIYYQLPKDLKARVILKVSDRQETVKENTKKVDFICDRLAVLN